MGESTLSVAKLTRQVGRLGSTVARLKLKGIGGGSHKWWSMWFNSTITEEPYPGLDILGISQKRESAARSPKTGTARSSSVRVVRCEVKSLNERNPCPMLDFIGDCPGNREEGGDDVRSAWSLCPGLHTCYNPFYNGSPSREAELIPSKVRSVRIGVCNSTP